MKLPQNLFPIALQLRTKFAFNVSSKIVMFLLGILITVLSPAATPITQYSFDDPHDSQRFQALLSDFRCLVCQNESLADSNADLAQDLRQLIYQQIQQHQSNQQIRHFLVDRYGQFVLYRPPLQASTFLLWFGPLIFLGIGFIIVWRLLRPRTPA